MLTFIVNNGKGYPYENVTVRFEKDEIPDSILNILLSSMNLCYSENLIGLDKNVRFLPFLIKLDLSLRVESLSNL